MDFDTLMIRVAMMMVISSFLHSIMATALTHESVGEPARETELR